MALKKMFIAGGWVAAQTGETISVISPVDGIQFDEISRGGAHEVDLAVQAAHKALEGPWGKLSATERGQVMFRIAEKVLEHQDELSKLESLKVAALAEPTEVTNPVARATTSMRTRAIFAKEKNFGQKVSPSALSRVFP